MSDNEQEKNETEDDNTSNHPSKDDQHSPKLSPSKDDQHSPKLSPSKDEGETKNTDQQKPNPNKEISQANPPTQQEETISKVKRGPKKSKTRNKKERINKIYRTPSTPSPTELLLKEKSFVLDCNATSSISRDYSGTNPKLGPVIPPYNAQRDKHVGAYFKFWGVSRTLKKTGQFKGKATSIEGPVTDRFQQTGPGVKYLTLRNQSGAGHSQEAIDGHAQFMRGIATVSGYNGKFGFRRNTPWLRTTPTQFTQHIIYPTH